jgi:hypothetical protein
VSTPHDDYKRLELPAGAALLPCPVCAADAELWQYSEADNGPTSKVGMCSRGEAFGPQSGIKNEGCLLYMPPDDFYRPTAREAVRFWNDYASALMKIQRAGRWARANVLRGASHQPAESLGAGKEQS